MSIRKAIVLVIVILLLVSFTPTCPAMDGGQITEDEHFTDLGYIEDEILVRFKPEIASDPAVLADRSASLHAETGGTLIKDLAQAGYEGTHVVKLPANLTMEEGLALYKRDPQVQYAEPNYIHRFSAIPDDPFFREQWGLRNNGQTEGTPGADIDAPGAWNLTTGSENVVIAVIDTGIDYTHPDLFENMWINADENPDNGIDDDGNGYIDDYRGWDFYRDVNDPIDSHGHGTHIAGIIGAVGNNNLGTTGVNWNVSIMPLKVDRSGVADTSAIVEAINYATDNGASIVSCSFGSDHYSQIEREAINSSDALFVCSSGNEGKNLDVFPKYPASLDCDNIISVAATDHNDMLASFAHGGSNYGNISVDVAAPGWKINSTIITEKTLFIDNMENLSNWIAEEPWGPAIVSDQFGNVFTVIADSPGGNYTNNANYTLKLREPIDCSNCIAPLLIYRYLLSVQNGHDGFVVEASVDGEEWMIISSTSNDLGVIITQTDAVDLSQFKNSTSLFIRFRFVSDEGVTAEGLYLDAMLVTAFTPGQNEYDTWNGTSLATPYVAGLAGLVKSVDQNMTATEVKRFILDNVDRIDALEGKVATGGRINAFNTLNALNTAQNVTQEQLLEELNETGATV